MHFVRTCDPVTTISNATVEGPSAAQATVSYLSDNLVVPAAISSYSFAVNFLHDDTIRAMINQCLSSCGCGC